MSTTLTANDQRLRESVMRQLAWDPEFDASMIGVAAKDGIVTLTGYIATYVAKLAAERATRRVYGVQAVVNELEVRLAQDRIDPEIARDALEGLKARVDVPLGLGVTVRDGFVTLTGTVEWMYQRAAAERAVKYLRGVRGVMNRIEIRPHVSPKDVQSRIVEALHRHADIDARRIHVDVHGGTVTLSGSVRSWIEKEESEHAAWRAAGVTSVDNRVAVVP